MSVTTQEIIDALVYPNLGWSGPISFSIPRPGSNWSSYPANGEHTNPDFGYLNAAQADVFRAAVWSWDRLVAMDIPEVDDIGVTGHIRVAFTDGQDFGRSAGAQGYAYLAPTYGAGSNTSQHADVWLDEVLKTESFAPTGLALFAIVHEIAHGLGLKHSIGSGPELPAEFQNYRYTVLTNAFYDDYLWKTVRPGFAPQVVWDWVLPSTPMMFDIVAIQAKYGAEAAAFAGVTDYRWSQDRPIMETVYDPGGLDTFDLANLTRGSLVDLTPGSFSSIGYWSAADQAQHWIAHYPALASQIGAEFARPDTYAWSRNVGIAMNTVIENVIGSSGADTVQGNDVANAVWGRAGDDTLAGGAGDDFLRGDEGADRLAGGDGFDDLHGNMGSDTVAGGAGPDWVVGGKDDDSLYGDDGDDVVLGNLGNDTLEGGAGADVVRGGQADDLVAGGFGDDFLAGDLGSDTITGGAGADIFHSHAAAGLDRVLDFNRLEGDRVNLLPGTGWQALQVGADVVIEMGPQGRLVLVGVQLASLTGEWIFGP